MYAELKLTLNKPLSRQLVLARLQDKKKKAGAISASILVEVNDTYSDILVGEKISFRRRLGEALCDKFWSKFLPALLTAGAALHFLANTPAVNSAIVGLVAATAGALLEAALAARAGARWKWKEST